MRLQNFDEFVQRFLREEVLDVRFTPQVEEIHLTVNILHPGSQFIHSVGSGVRVIILLYLHGMVDAEHGRHA